MTRILPVESRNQWFQRVEALKRNRKKRHREGAFVVEGVRSLNQLALNPDWDIEAYLYAPSRPLSKWAEDTLASSRAHVHLELSAALLEELSDKDDGSEMLAVVKIPDDDAARLPQRAQPLYVLLDQPSLPGNLGSILRSCDGLGVDGVVVFGHAADLYDPRTVRGAAGSLFSLPVIRLTTWGLLQAWLDNLRVGAPDLQVLGTTARGGVGPDQVGFAQATVLVFGSEASGMSYKVAELCAAHLCIPMTGSASSLNVACAATAVLYEASRQRRALDADILASGSPAALYPGRTLKGD